VSENICNATFVELRKVNLSLIVRVLQMLGFMERIFDRKCEDVIGEF
jgi:hypothetical protein